MKKIIPLIISILVLAGVVVYKVLPKLQDSSTAPSGIQMVPKSIVRNAAGSVDYYVYIHNKDGENLNEKASVYSYEFWSGIDFGKEKIKIEGDSVFVPHSKILSVDQEDSAPMNVLSRGGDINFNDVYTPIKSAVQKMVKDYAWRSDVNARSEKYMAEMLGNINPTKNFTVDNAPNEESVKFKFPYSSLEIDYYPDVLSRKYEIEVMDSTGYNLYEVAIRDVEKDKYVLLVRYDGKWSRTFNDTMKWIKTDYNADETYYNIVDPVNPREKVLVATGTKSDFFIGGNTYAALSCVKDEESYKRDYFSDMLYLMSCIHESPNAEEKPYHAWADMYFEAIKEVNKGYFSSAKKILSAMSGYQDGYKSEDEEYLLSLVSILNGDRDIPKTSNEDFNAALDLYSSIVLYHGNGLNINKERRQKLYDSIDEGNHYVKGLVARYYLKNRYSDYVETETYMNYIIQNGLPMEKEYFETMDNAKFNSYMTNLLHSSAREVFGDEYSREAYNDIIKITNYDALDGVKVAKLIVQGGNEEELRDIDYVMSRLQKAKVVIDKNSVPMFIVLFRQDRNTILDPDKDALIFSRGRISYVGNYTGKNIQDVESKKYEDIDVMTTGKVKFTSSKQYFVESGTLYTMVKSLHDTFSQTNDNSLDREIKRGLTQYIIDLTNDELWRGMITYQP